MRIFEEYDGRCALALGNFDGLHKAHMKIINSCVEYSKSRGIQSGVVLFDRHTSEVFGGAPEILTTMEEKLLVLEKAKVDFVHIIRFDRELAMTEGEEFLHRILSAFDAEAFFFGYDYSFGKGAACKASDMEKIGRRLGFEAFMTECVYVGDTAVSSTVVRECIKAGDMQRAEKLLTRPYFLAGEIVHGKGNGAKSLFPTVNVKTPEKKLLPPDGVYCAVAEIDGKKYKCALNIGKNPTFNASVRTVEGFLLDFNSSVYGKKIYLEIKEFLRSDKKFANAEDLKKQIEKDIEAVRREI